MFNLKSMRTIGFYYLAIIVCGIFSEGFVRMSLIDPSNTQQTVQNIVGFPFLYRIGIVGDLIMVVADICVGVGFYFILKSISQPLSTLALTFRLGQASIIGLNTLNLVVPLLILKNPEFVKIFDPGKVSELIQLFLNAHRYGYLISQILFSFNCLIMAYLIFHSTHFSKALAWGVGLSALVYGTDAFGEFLFFGFSQKFSMAMMIPVITELSLCFWLIFTPKLMPLKE